MTARQSDGSNRPFADLERLIKQRGLKLTDASQADNCAPDHPLSPREEAQLFAQAMAEVRPLKSNHHWRPTQKAATGSTDQHDDEDEVRQALQALVRNGTGYCVADTAEYMEAASPGIAKEILRRLHNGRYAIQAHIDLHGLRSIDAETALHKFIRGAILKGHRAVLVVHGRGLSSPKTPVLKKLVYNWLIRGPFRKWVIALASARPCDGGAGATYVLLRQRPVTSRERRRR